MGYAKNHLATIVMAVFAAILTALWPYFVDFAPILQFIFIMAVPISWFLVVILWLAQKSADYMHGAESHETHYEKKSLSSSQISQASDDKQIGTSEIKEAQTELSNKLDQLKETVRLKDSEIERLNQEIANLQTLVEIESLKTELANLKMMASERKTRKTKK